MRLQRENKFKKAFLNITLALSIAGTVFFGANTIQNFQELQSQDTASQTQIELVNNAINENYQEPIIIDNSSGQNEKVLEDDVHEPKYNFEQLWQTNPNIVGVIEGDCFEGGFYPVVATNNMDEENYYLYHSVDGTESSAGSIFADYQNDNSMQSDVTVLWGHNLIDRGNMMFAGLHQYENQDYYENNQKLKYYTPNGEYELEVFASINGNPLEQTIGNYSSEEELVNYMNNIQNNSLISSNTHISGDDRVMILNTCTNLGSRRDPENRYSVYTKVNPVWEKTMEQSKTR